MRRHEVTRRARASSSLSSNWRCSRSATLGRITRHNATVSRCPSLARSGWDPLTALTVIHVVIGEVPRAAGR